MATSDQINTSIANITAKLQEFKPQMLAIQMLDENFKEFAEAHLTAYSNSIELQKQSYLLQIENAKTLKNIWRTLTPQADATVQTGGTSQLIDTLGVSGTELK